MNETKHLPRRTGFMFCSVVTIALAGCTVYQGAPQDGGVYVEPSGQSDVSYVEIRAESDFYEPLSPYGRWEVVGSYGQCWIPGGVDADWSPYSNGYWQQTDAGWYWASDEPWGWATYHYGRWDSSPQFGWYWVPQTQWAPAWVSWREGGGYVGWAPLSPSGRSVEVNRRGAAPGGYVFVEERRFMEPVRPAAVNVNVTVINQTVINKGPATAVIERASGRKMQAVQVRQLRSKEEARVAVRHPAQTPTGAKAAPAAIQRQAEKALPAREPRPVEKPAVTTAQPKPPETRNEVNPADGQSRAAKLDEEKRAQQETARQKEGEKANPVPAAVETRQQTRPEARPEEKVEPKPVAERPAVTREPPRQQTRPEAKPEAQPEAKHEPQPKAKVEAQPAAERPAATRQPAEQKPGKDEEKKD